jgi:hypothetical protein
VLEGGELTVRGPATLLVDSLHVLSTTLLMPDPEDDDDDDAGAPQTKANGKSKGKKASKKSSSSKGKKAKAAKKGDSKKKDKKKDKKKKGGGPVGTVTICHLPSGNPGGAHTLTIPITDLAGHLGHGDVVGECDATPVIELVLGSRLIIDASDGPVLFYCTGDVEVDRASSIENETEIPMDLQIYATTDTVADPTQIVSFASAEPLHALVYAPFAAFTFVDVEIFGAVIGRQLALASGTAIHHDLSAASLVFGEDSVRVVSWRRLSEEEVEALEDGTHLYDDRPPTEDAAGNCTSGDSTHQ